MGFDVPSGRVRLRLAQRLLRFGAAVEKTILLCDPLVFFSLNFLAEALQIDDFIHPVINVFPPATIDAIRIAEVRYWSCATARQHTLW